jgi:hypothetical protein
MGIFIVFCGVFVLFGIFQFILTKLFKNKLSIKSINILSLVLSISIPSVLTYVWIQKDHGPVKNIEVKNFKIEKSLVTIEPDFVDNKKRDLRLCVLYSCDITNNDEDLKNFKLSSEFLLNNFNKMGDFKTVRSFVNVFDSSLKPIEFNDIKLFHKGEILKVYGFLDLNKNDTSEISWFRDNIPFVTELKFKIDGGTSEEEYKFNGRELESKPNLSGVKEYINNSINNPSTIKLEYYTDGLNYTLLKNDWSEKLKKFGKVGNSTLSNEEIIRFSLGNY